MGQTALGSAPEASFTGQARPPNPGPDKDEPRSASFAARLIPGLSFLYGRSEFRRRPDTQIGLAEARQLTVQES